LYYKYGLVSYLYPRARGDQRHWFDDDTARDAAAKAGWNHFIAGFDSSGGGPGYHINLQNEVHFTNEVATIKDPWSRTYQYRCPPPHIRFKLWSVGPDGVNNTVDDILYSNE
jgi:hypothetical protein